MQKENLIVNTLKICNSFLPGMELIPLDSTLPVSSWLFCQQCLSRCACPSVCAHAKAGAQVPVGFHLEALYLFWCGSIPEPLDLLESSVYFFLKGFSCIRDFKKATAVL